MNSKPLLQIPGENLFAKVQSSSPSFFAIIYIVFEVLPRFMKDHVGSSEKKFQGIKLLDGTDLEKRRELGDKITQALKVNMSEIFYSELPPTILENCLKMRRYLSFLLVIRGIEIDLNGNFLMDCGSYPAYLEWKYSNRKEFLNLQVEPHTLTPEFKPDVSLRDGIKSLLTHFHCQVFFSSLFFDLAIIFEIPSCFQRFSENDHSPECRWDLFLTKKIIWLIDEAKLEYQRDHARTIKMNSSQEVRKQRGFRFLLSLSPPFSLFPFPFSLFPFPFSLFPFPFPLSLFSFLSSLFSFLFSLFSFLPEVNSG